MSAGIPTEEYRQKLQQMPSQQAQADAIRGHGKAMRRTFKGGLTRKEAQRLSGKAKRA